MVYVLGLTEGYGTFFARIQWVRHDIQQHHPVVRHAKLKSVGFGNRDITSDGKIKGVAMFMSRLLYMLGKRETVQEVEEVCGQ